MRPNVKPGTPRCPAKLVLVCLVGVAVVGEAVVLNEVEALTTVTLVRVVGVAVLDWTSEVELAGAVVGAGEGGAAEDSIVGAREDGAIEDSGAEAEEARGVVE